MPELGKYAAEVLSAYGVSLLLIAGLVALSLRRSGKVHRQLREIEERQRRDGR